MGVVLGYSDQFFPINISSTGSRHAIQEMVATSFCAWWTPYLVNLLRRALKAQVPVEVVIPEASDT